MSNGKDSGWISVETRMPHYGDPVIIQVGGTVQNITYMRDGADDTPDWFEPYHFEHDDELKAPISHVKWWRPLPEPISG